MNKKIFHTVFAFLLISVMGLLTLNTQKFDKVEAAYGADAFVMVWDTSGTNSAEIKVNGSFDYDFHIEWGDGTSEDLTNANLVYPNTNKFTHTYASPVQSSYEIVITGTFPYFASHGYGGKTSERNKIKEVKQWGTGVWQSMAYTFKYQNSLYISATDTPKFAPGTSLESMFETTNGVHGNFANWDLTNVTSTESMFEQAINFDEELNWNVSGVENMKAMFYGATSFNNKGMSSMNNWDASGVKDMSYMFAAYQQYLEMAFNVDISQWDTSSVTNMSHMFDGAELFNQDVGYKTDTGAWNVSNVTDMSYMFSDAVNFNNGGTDTINLWDTGNVINMEHMFETFRYEGNKPVISYSNVNISNWDTSKVTNMDSMFAGARAFNQDIGWKPATGAWNTGSVTTMKNMFYYALAFNNLDSTSISNWDTTNVTDMSGMFTHAEVFDHDLGSWDLLGVTDISHMFDGAYVFNNKGSGSISDWDTSTVTTMRETFSYAKAFNQDIGWDPNTSTGWDTSLVTDMYGMFEGATVFNNGDVAGASNKPSIAYWNISNVENMGAMFARAESFNQQIGYINASQTGWDVSNIKIMERMFDRAMLFNQDIGYYPDTGAGWNVSNVTDMSGMFSNTSNFTNGDSQSILDWDVSGVQDFSTMFSNTDKFNFEVGLWDVSSALDMSSMFSGAKAFNNGVLPGEFNTSLNTWDTSKVGLGKDYGLPTSTTYAPLKDGSFALMFQNALVFNQNIGNWDVSKARDISGMFKGATVFNNGSASDPNNNSIINWNVSGVTDFGLTFSHADAFNQPIGNWKVGANLQDGDILQISGMFAYSAIFNQPLLSWDVSKARDISGMFNGAGAFNQDIGWYPDRPVGEQGWDVSNVTNIASMFANTTAFNNGGSLSIGDWQLNQNADIDMTSIFRAAVSFNQPIGDWDTSRVTKFTYAFRDTVSFNQPLVYWDVSNATRLDFMFVGATSFDQDLGQWDLHPDANIRNFLSGVELSFPYADSLLRMLSNWNSNIATTPLTNFGYTGYKVFYCDAVDEYNKLDVDYVWTMSSLYFGDEECPKPKDWFITTWEVTADDLTIEIPTVAGEDYLYYINWGELIDESDPKSFWWDVKQTGNVSHTYAAPGTYTVKIFGKFPAIQFANGGDKDKLKTIEQWGTGTWTSMERAFEGAKNFIISPTIPDAPQFDIAGVSLKAAFKNTNITSGLENWNTTNVNDMSEMFYGATRFNGDISGWDTINVEYMNHMFFSAEVFNQPIGGWNVRKVTDMNGMFANASAFNQPIGDWRPDLVTDMNLMFYQATSFNQPIGDWTHTQVRDMNMMFASASAFNQPIGEWTTDLVEDMGMMFHGASSFNQPIGNWNTSNVLAMYSMFQDATSFDQNIGGWDITSVTDVTDMFTGITLSTSNYDSLLKGWVAQDPVDGLTFSAGGSKYCAEAAKDSLEAQWTITDGGPEAVCPLPYEAFADGFKTTWHVADDGDSITIPTHPDLTYNYSIYWEEGVTEENVTGSVSHNYNKAGDYEIAIIGTFPSFYLNDQAPAKNQLRSVKQWGNIAWSTMTHAFHGAAELVFTATDLPDLSNVTDLSYMFTSASSFDEDLGSWDVSTVENFHGMFSGATIFDNGGSDSIGNWVMTNATDLSSMFSNARTFNRNIGGWGVDLSNVKKMDGMFQLARTFNNGGSTSIGNWTVSSVDSMNSMFSYARSFNQPIGGWDTSSVTDMSGMFTMADVFNQPLGGWNVASVQSMNDMFSNAKSFDQNLGGWTITALTKATNMFAGVTLTTDNYDALLTGWDAQDPIDGVIFSGGESKYCAVDARNSLLAQSWTISDRGKDVCNGSPTNILLNGETGSIWAVLENDIANKFLGELSTVHSNDGASYTYSFCPDSLADSAYFQIAGNQFSTQASFDFELPQDGNADNTYEICIRTSDVEYPELFFEKTFQVVINNIIEGPFTLPGVPTINAQGRCSMEPWTQNGESYHLPQEWCLGE